MRVAFSFWTRQTVKLALQTRLTTVLVPARKLLNIAKDIFNYWRHRTGLHSLYRLILNIPHPSQTQSPHSEIACIRWCVRLLLLRDVGESNVKSTVTLSCNAALRISFSSALTQTQVSQVLAYSAVPNRAMWPNIFILYCGGILATNLPRPANSAQVNHDAGNPPPLSLSSQTWDQSMSCPARGRAEGTHMARHKKFWG